MIRARTSVLAWAVSGATLLGGPGCAYYSQEDGERLHDEVYALQQQVTVLQSKLEAAEAARDEQRAALDRIEEELKKKGGYDADFGVQLDQMRNVLAGVEGRVGTLEQRTNVHEEQLAVLGRRSDVLEGKKKLDDALQALLSDPNRALAEVEKLIAAGEAEDARQLLTELEMRHRSEAGWGVYAPKAQYLLGETYFAEKNWRAAIPAFSKIRKDYPEAKTWIPGSLLRIGQCLENLGLKDDAAIIYEQAAEAYPRHPKGREARRLLRRLRG